MAPIGGAQGREHHELIGALFLAAIVCYGSGSSIADSALADVDSVSPESLAVGALLMLCNSLIVVTIGALVFPVVRDHGGERAGVLYFGVRCVEGILLAVGIVANLSHIALAPDDDAGGGNTRALRSLLHGVLLKFSFFTYQMAMLSLGVGSVPLFMFAFQSGLLPRLLSLWGVLGYTCLAVGAGLEIYGVPVGLALSGPGGLFELTLAIWLIARGFAHPPALTVLH
jgi:hypothetical protein